MSGIFGEYRVGGYLGVSAEQGNDRGMGQHCWLAGVQPNLPDDLASLDVFVLTSEYEAFGLVLVEACAMGVPCIATHTGGVPEMLYDDGGRLVPVNDPQVLAGAMNQMRQPETLRYDQQKTKQISQRFSAGQMLAAYRQLYQTLLNNQQN